mmetsp:Transcript_9238/g.10768  ORF Transcript_9238/g.10768 Transcript_9238/m.10768 type:complete len:107 (-) Transcript_9238:163-483(-)
MYWIETFLLFPSVQRKKTPSLKKKRDRQQEHNSLIPRNSMVCEYYCTDEGVERRDSNRNKNNNNNNTTTTTEKEEEEEIDQQQQKRKRKRMINNEATFLLQYLYYN